jgi:hypothetical protein
MEKETLLEICDIKSSLIAVIGKGSLLLNACSEALFSQLSKKIKIKILLNDYTVKEANDFIKERKLRKYQVKIVEGNWVNDTGDWIMKDDCFCVFSPYNQRDGYIEARDKRTLSVSRNIFDLIWAKSPSIIYCNDVSEILNPEEENKIFVATKDFYDKLIYEFKKHPELIRSISPFQFEEVVARLLRQKGYDVQVTPKVGDGGKDILARFLTPTKDKVLCYVECKKYDLENPVGVGVVRSLYGTVMSDRVNMGMLVTSSIYTKGAINFQQLHSSQILLKDFNDLKIWINE